MTRQGTHVYTYRDDDVLRALSEMAPGGEAVSIAAIAIHLGAAPDHHRARATVSGALGRLAQRGAVERDGTLAWLARPAAAAEKPCNPVATVPLFEAADRALLIEGLMLRAHRAETADDVWRLAKLAGRLLV